MSRFPHHRQPYREMIGTPTLAYARKEAAVKHFIAWTASTMKDLAAKHEWDEHDRLLGLQQYARMSLSPHNAPYLPPLSIFHR